MKHPEIMTPGYARRIGGRAKAHGDGRLAWPWAFVQCIDFIRPKRTRLHRGDVEFVQNLFQKHAYRFACLIGRDLGLEWSFPDFFSALPGNPLPPPVVKNSSWFYEKCRFMHDYDGHQGCSSYTILIGIYGD
jgi:hypothetical protein